MTYKHTQPGTWILIFFAAATLLILFSQAGVAANASWVALIVLIPASLLFSSQTIAVDDQTVTWHFGFGFWKKQLPVSEIAATSVVRNKWYYGLGIRLTPHGWLYAVSGLDAVEITRKDGSRIRLGSDEPQTLLAALQQHVP